MANTAPKLTVSALTVAAIGNTQAFRDIYVGADGEEYIIYVGNMTDADTDSIFALREDVTAASGYSQTTVASGLTKYKEYTFAIHNSRVYISNGTDAMIWIYCNSGGTWSKGYIANAPIAEYLIAAKNRLFIGGTSTTKYATGTATFTQNSYAVTGQSTEFIDNARAGDQIGISTPYTTGTATFTTNSATVTGQSTVWSTNISPGDRIQLDADAVYYEVAYVTSNTSLTLVKEYEDTGDTTAAYTAQTDPTVWYTVASITNDTSLTLTDHYAAATAATNTYVIKRISNDVIYWSAEECLNDWQTSGIQGGDNAGLIKINAPNTGLHNFDDAVIFFHNRGGEFIQGTDTSTWTIPKHMRLPVNCVSHDSIVSKDGWLGFMSKQGFHISKGGALNFSDLQMTPFSDSIKKTIADIDPEKLALVKSAIWEDTLYIQVPSQETYDSTDSELGYSTGTVTVSDASTSVAGTNTVWRGVIRPGDQIQFASDTTWYGIVTVTSDTAIVLDRNKDTTLTGGTYAIRKRRNNRILAIDTRTNVDLKRSYGWSVYNDVNTNGFVVLNGSSFYGSSTSGSLYQFNTGGTFYAGPISASAKTGAWTCGKRYEGVRKFFKAFKTRAKGTGVVYITPYIDGVAGTQVFYNVTDTSNYEEITFPATGQPFSGRGFEIEFLIELTGSDEDCIVKRPKVGFIPLKKV